MKERINTISTYLKETLGAKTVKLSLDGGFTCPNRDGTKGTGGCLFCSAAGSGDNASTIKGQIQLLSAKWPNAKYLAFFQSHTATYAPVSHLRKLYGSALADPRICGLVIATRPDCLPMETLDLLSEIARDHFLWVELGLQTVHPATAKAMNLCYTYQDYQMALAALQARHIPVVTHLILGLPGETRAQMFQSVQEVCAGHPWGLKLHLFNLVKGAPLASQMPHYVPFDRMEDYVSLVCDLLEVIPPDILIHRLTGDVPYRLLLSPSWSYRKRTILNEIQAEMKRRDSWQGQKSLRER